MNPQSTDRTGDDTSQSVPVIIKRGVATSNATMNTSFTGSPYFAYFATNNSGLDIVINLNDIRVDVNTKIDVWFQLVGQSRLYKAPITTMDTASGSKDINCFYYSVRSGEITQLVIRLSRGTTLGSASNQFKFYYNIYSTKITDDNIL